MPGLGSYFLIMIMTREARSAATDGILGSPITITRTLSLSFGTTGEELALGPPRFMTLDDTYGESEPTERYDVT